MHPTHPSSPSLEFVTKSYIYLTCPSHDLILWPMNNGQSHPALRADQNRSRQETGPRPETKSSPPRNSLFRSSACLHPSAFSRYTIAPLEAPESSDLQPFAFGLQPFHVSSVNIGSCTRCYRIAPLKAPASSDLQPLNVAGGAKLEEKHRFENSAAAVRSSMSLGEAQGSI